MGVEYPGGEQTSAQRKLARGVEQVQTLSRETLAFEDSQAYTFRVEREPRSRQEIVYRCFAVEGQPPPGHWPLLAGEAIQNLRSCLDHFVWSAWRGAGNTGDGDHTQFPIAIDAERFRAQAGRVLQGVPAPIRAIIESAQPYSTLPDGPEFDDLERLRILSNIDKHRTLTAVASAIHLEYVGVGEGVVIEWHDIATNKPLGHGETYVSTFTARAERELEDVDVNPGFSYKVRIEGMSIDVLVSIARHVYRVLHHLETGEELSPLASYPI